MHLVEKPQKENDTEKPCIIVIGLKGLPAFGGAATVGENIINQLKEDFKFIVLSVESHAQKDFAMGDVEQVIFKRFPIARFNIVVYYLKCALYVLLAKGCNLVHLHHTDGAFILPLLKLRNKVVLTSHARPQDNAKWSKWVNVFFKMNEKIAIGMADIFTAVSKPLKKAYATVTKREIIYIPNGVDLALAKCVTNTVVDEPYLLFAAGRIISSKGLHVFLQALKKADVHIKLKVAGDLNNTPEYKKQILELSKGLNIEFLGMIKERERLLQLVANAQIFVYPTQYEAMSIMLFEAALVKVPIICSDISANKAVFSDDDVTFFKCDDVNDLVDRLQYAFKHKDECDDKTKNAFVKLKNNYTWENIAIEYKRVYNELLKH